MSVFERAAIWIFTYNLESLDIERIVVKRLAIGPLGQLYQLIDGSMLDTTIYKSFVSALAKHMSLITYPFTTLSVHMARLDPVSAF